MPRKGFDVAIRAVAALRRSRPDLVLAIAGGGRDERRLRRLAAELDAPVRFLGRVSNDDLPRLYGCADVFTMPCRTRWGGLEQEGFGIVFVEAAACGVPQVAGDRAAPPRPWSTARPGWSCGRPTTGARWPTPSPACSTTRPLRATMGGGRAGPRRRRVLLRRARRTAWAGSLGALP